MFVFACVLLSLPLVTLAQDDLAGTLTVSVEAWMVEKYNMPELEARFEADHPNVDVVVLTHEGLGANYLNIFLEWAQTNASTADLYFGGLISQLSPAIIDDQLLPWDGILVDELAPENWIPAFLDSAYVAGSEGSNYPTLPGLGETMNFQYNTNHFVAAGLVDEAGNPQVPATYEELYDAACTLSQTEVNGQPLIGLEMEYNINFAPDTWMAAVIAAEGTYLTEDGRPNWDSEAGQSWIEFQKSIIDAGCGGTSVFTDNNGARNALKAGQAAMINASNSRLNEGTNALCPEQGEVPCPSGEVIQGFDYPGDGGVLAFSHQIYIPRVAANPELAQAFAREQILGEYAQTWSAINFGKMPTIWANYDALPENVNFELVRVELEGPAMGQWQYRDGQTLRQAYVDELQRYLIGDQTLEAMIENLHAATDSADLTVPGTEM
jgi:ABC-type glycerol-3-phosphate transport system substrate-binding protein